MTIKTILAILFLILFISCTGHSPKSTNPEKLDSTKIFIIRDEHQAQNSLDVAGTYKGTLPCADCSGIETEIQINGDHTFVRKLNYLGKAESQVFGEKGTYSWNEAGNIIILNEIKNGPNRYFVSENMLIQLDLSGIRITGKLAEMYVLKKVKQQ